MAEAKDFHTAQGAAPNHIEGGWTRYDRRQALTKIRDGGRWKYKGPSVELHGIHWEALQENKSCKLLHGKNFTRASLACI